MFTARLLHTMLRVSDMDRTLAFYCGTLGMAVQMDRTDPDGYRNTFVGYGPAATTTLVEFGCRPGETPSVAATGFDHIALEISDVVATVARLRAAGVPIVREAKAAASGALIAIITDPDGYRIELIQPMRQG